MTPKVHFTIQAAADYWRQRKAPKAFLAILTLVKRILCFNRERANKLVRCTEIIELYARDVPIRDIQDKYGCSRNTILRYARAAGLAKRPKHYPEKIRLAALAMCEQRKPYAEISARLGVSEAYLSNLAKANGMSRYKRVRA